MFGNVRVLAVVPARGGSKGLPRKNVRLLAGLPLIAHTALVIQKLPWIDRAVVSTDDDEIAATAEAYGLAAPFRRPAALSGDLIGDVDVLVQALATLERRDRITYDVILMLQPTSPMRRPEHVEAAMRMLTEGQFDSVWSVSPSDPKVHPYKQLTINDGQLDHYDERGKNIIARQELSTLYHRNGVVYAIRRKCLLEERTIRGTRCGALVINEPIANIDDALDLEFAEFLYSRLHGRDSK